MTTIRSIAVFPQWSTSSAQGVIEAAVTELCHVYREARRKVLKAHGNATGDRLAKERLKTNKGGDHAGMGVTNLSQAGKARDAAGKAFGVSGRSGRPR